MGKGKKQTEQAEETSPAEKKAPRMNASIVYPVGAYSFRRSPENPQNVWEVLSERPNKEGLLPESTSVLATYAKGKDARTKCEELNKLKK